MNPTLRQLAAVAVLVGLFAAAPAHADRFELGLGTASRWMPSNTVLALHDANTTGFGLGGAMRWATIGGFDLLADISYSTDSSHDTTFRRLDTKTDTSLWLAGVRARRDIAPYTSAHARAALGVARITAEINDLSSDSHIADHDWTMSAYVGAGIDFTPVPTRLMQRQAKVSFGLRAELGYLAMTSAALESHTGTEEMNAGVIEIPTSAASLGDLNLSALMLQLSVIGRF